MEKRLDELMTYLTELRMLDAGSYKCNREIGEVVAEIRKEIGLDGSKTSKPVHIPERFYVQVNDEDGHTKNVAFDSFDDVLDFVGERRGDYHAGYKRAAELVSGETKPPGHAEYFWQKARNISRYSTKELADELAKRDGVETHKLTEGIKTSVTADAPTRVLVIADE